ncbi:uncharacterized protein PHACADRAFT_207437 [Phanerochaete carnosa HHB-10118-sp]|uniref:Uncharacterized protein n=1 Tax=Phanerochaete carnosa (strain HHB-10118-sp) TaxID=650164 RepID=K5WH23_PHACS|nr:uncharacterized protein PHACADRAFT_207437 [Phanerochaete carnosa HHB-10118-sp]EKM58630.1 hypothetical protein PHACADRAFT_207437 [Phanerochaete carnosa HHB-10118-sp]
MAGPDPVAPHDISISETNLVGVWASGPLLGLSIALYICYIRLFADESRNIHKTTLLAIATLQVIVSIAGYISSLADLVRGFIVHVNDPTGPNGYFTPPGRPAYVAEFAFWAINYIIGDGIMAWRCYVVWGRNPWIGSVYVALVAGLAAVSLANVGFIAESAHTTDIFAATHAPIAPLAPFCISMTVQVSATTLITWKILRTSRWGDLNNNKRRLALIWAVIESGAILTSATAVLTVLEVLKFEAGAMMTPIITQLSFLVPTSIVVRARMKQGMAKRVIPLHGLHGNGVTLREKRSDPNEARSPGGSTDSTAITVSISTATDLKVDEISSFPSQV